MNIFEFYDNWQLDEAASTFTRDHKTTGSGTEIGVGAPENLDTVLDNMFRKDETVAAAITTKVDAVMASDYYFEATNQSNKKVAKKLITPRLLRQVLFNLFLYGNCFVEIERSQSGKPVAYHVVETYSIHIHDPEGHGEPEYYRQRIGGEEIVIPKDDLYHFRLDRVTTGLWAEIPVQPVARYVALKMWIKNHVHDLFAQNMFRPVMYIEKGISNDELDRIISYIKEARYDRLKPFVNYGEGKVEPYMRFQDGEVFKEWIDKADSAILTQFQVPPIMAGLPDNSGRASGEQETYKAFNTHIQGVMSILQGEFLDFFIQSGLTGVELLFGEPDRKTEKDVLEMAIQLKAMGAKPEKLTKWLRKQGMDLEEDFFDEDFFMSPSQMDRNALSNPTNQTSRRGKNDGEMNERVGTGSEGTTREDQLVDEAAIRYQVLDDRVLERARRLAR